MYFLVETEKGSYMVEAETEEELRTSFSNETILFQRLAEEWEVTDIKEVLT